MKTARKKEWFDNDAFWIDMYPYMFTRNRLLKGANAVDGILQLVQPSGKAILDLCCGPGRCAVPLARKGFTVTGVDRTRFLLKKARARARYAKVKIEWIQQDMRDFTRPDAFHTVLSMFTSFGYFDNKSEDVKVLQNMFTSLKPGGKCLIDVMGKERLAGCFSPTTSKDFPDGTVLIQRHEVLDDWTRMGNEWILIRNGRSRSFKFHHTIYSGQELKDRLEGVGFRKVKLYGSLAGDEYGLRSTRLIALAQKPTQRRRVKKA